MAFWKEIFYFFVVSYLVARDWEITAESLDALLVLVAYFFSLVSIWIILDSSITVCAGFAISVSLLTLLTVAYYSSLIEAWAPVFDFNSMYSL